MKIVDQSREHQPVVEISMKLLQVGTSSSLKSRKFVNGGNQDSIVWLLLRRGADSATVGAERLVPEVYRSLT